MSMEKVFEKDMCTNLRDPEESAKKDDHLVVKNNHRILVKVFVCCGVGY